MKCIVPLLFVLASCSAPLVATPGLCIDDACIRARIVVEGDSVEVEVLEAELPDASAFASVEYRGQSGTVYVQSIAGDVTAGYCVDVLVWEQCGATDVR